MTRRLTYGPVFLSLCLIILLVAFASLPAAAQQEAPAAPSVSAASSAAPAAYNPAAVAFATPKPKPSGGGSSNGPDPSMKWEVEVHGGGMLVNNPLGGTGSLPNPGPSFTTVLGSTSRYIHSWYFGDGALLYNQNVTNTANANITNKITPLDPVLMHSAAHRQNGAAFGARLYREFTPRWGLELSFDYNMGSLDISGDTINGINASSTSWLAAWSQRMTPPGCPGCVTTAFTSNVALDPSEGSQFLFTGGFVLNLTTHGRAIPYIVGGVGVTHNMGDTPSASLTGNYQFNFFGSLINETDHVNMNYQIADNVFTGYIGGGVKYYVTPRWGVRLDIRDHIMTNTIDNLVSATPSFVPVAGGSCGVATGVNPDIQWCNNSAVGSSSLLVPLGPFRTFAGSGVQHQVGLTAGIFYRF